MKSKMQAMFFTTLPFVEVISQLRVRQLQSILEDSEQDMQFILIILKAQTTASFLTM